MFTKKQIFFQIEWIFISFIVGKVTSSTTVSQFFVKIWNSGRRTFFSEAFFLLGMFEKISSVNTSDLDSDLIQKKVKA